MHVHVYPYAGQGRRLTMDVLKLLYRSGSIKRIPPKIHNRFLAVFYNVFLVNPIGYTKTITNESCMTVALS